MNRKRCSTQDCWVSFIVTSAKVGAANFTYIGKQTML